MHAFETKILMNPQENFELDVFLQYIAKIL